MPEAATVEFKFFENVKKGRGVKEIPRKIKLTQKNGVEFLRYCWNSDTHFSVDLVDAKSKLTKAEQVEAFGKTIRDMDRELQEAAKPVEIPAVEVPAPNVEA